MCLGIENAIAIMDSHPVSDEKQAKFNGVPHSSLQEAFQELSSGKKGQSNSSCWYVRLICGVTIFQHTTKTSIVTIQLLRQYSMLS